MRARLSFVALAAMVIATIAPARGTGIGPDPVAVGDHEWNIDGTIWVANRTDDSIAAFDVRTKHRVATVAMAPGSRPSDLAYANGKLYVSEEFGSAPSVAIVNAASGTVVKRLRTTRPHHMHVSEVIDDDAADGVVSCSGARRLVAYSIFDTNLVGIIDARSDEWVREWQASEHADARTHAGVFGPRIEPGTNDLTLYAANDVRQEISAVDPWTGERLWALDVPAAHELIVTRDGSTAYVSGRTRNVIYTVDLQAPAIDDERPIVFDRAVLPDTLQLTADEQTMTVGLRASPAQIAVVDLPSRRYKLVTIGGPRTRAGHQWTSPDGHYTFAAFDGPGAGIAVIDHRDNDAVVKTLPYPGAPHGVAFAPNRRHGTVGDCGVGHAG